jgi:Rrf2 family protein
MKVSAKSDYAIRAAVHIAAANGSRVKAEELAAAAGIPRQFLENILAELRRGGVVRARRGSEGGYELARPPTEIDVGMVLAAIGSPLADEPGAPGAGEPGLPVQPVQDVWLALRSSTRTLLERVTLADLVSGSLPDDVRRLAREERLRQTGV